VGSLSGRMVGDHGADALFVTYTSGGIVKVDGILVFLYTPD
jgi:hypothetical protein